MKSKHHDKLITVMYAISIFAIVFSIAGVAIQNLPMFQSASQQAAVYSSFSTYPSAPDQPADIQQ